MSGSEEETMLLDGFVVSGETECSEGIRTHPGGPCVGDLESSGDLRKVHPLGPKDGSRV